MPAAVLPYYHIPVFDLGPIPIDPWATLVCIGFIVGMEMARSRGIRLGLDVRDVVDGIVVTVGLGFLVGHLVHVMAYHPDLLSTDGVMSLLKVWGGFSSMGGMLGAIIGSVLFYRFWRKRPYWVHADVIMYGFPFGWLFGRAGCAVVHDHIGRPSDFFLAVEIPGMGSRHELGLYEALYTLVIAGTFLILGRKVRKPGFFLATWCLMYAPVRFGLDFLRNTDLENADVRWGGLTPAQYACILLLLAGVAIVRWLQTRPAPTIPPPDDPPPTTESPA